VEYRRGVIEMTQISQLSTNSFWSTQYARSIFNNRNSVKLEQNQMDYNFPSLQMLSNSSAQRYQEQQSQYRTTIADFTNSVRDVNNSIKSLTTTNFFSQKSVASTNAAVTGEAKNGAKAIQYDVGISQIAKAQQNEGKSLTANSYSSGVSTGYSSLGIQVGSGTEVQLSVNVLATDNNGQILKKFANAINSSDTGVQAEVKTKNNAQYLSITSKDTGAANGFTIRDVSGTAGAALQLSNKVTNAADAHYTVNGVNYQTATNQVSLDNGNVSLQLHNVTTGNSKLTVGIDNHKIVEVAKGLVANYNSLNHVFATSDNATKRGERLLDNVEYLVGKTRVADFAAIGISVNRDSGELKLDEKKFTDALVASPDKVKGLLTGGASLGKTVERVTKQIGANPISNYLKPPNPLEVTNYSFQYNNAGWMAQQNNYMTQGLFLNMMV
jgi:flagellar hook-associated protein 2